MLSVSKSIDTLVEDIYSVFDNGVKPSPEAVRRFSDDLATLVAERLEAYQRPQEPRLRMSNLGRNPLQLWYDINGYPEGSPNKPEVMDSQTKFKLLYGDVLEVLVLFLAEQSGHDVQSKQEKVKYNGVEGTLDCTIDGHVVDVKSASSFAMGKFSSEQMLRDDDSFGYVSQLSGYCNAKGCDRGFFLAVGKETGQLKLCEIHADDMEDRINYMRGILQSKSPPYRCDNDKLEGTSGNRVLAYPCTYCNHKHECWKDANGGRGLRSFEYSNGIKYLTNVNKLPKVEEII